MVRLWRSTVLFIDCNKAEYYAAQAPQTESQIGSEGQLSIHAHQSWTGGRRASSVVGEK